MTTLTFGSLFAGVGGFDLGFESAGYECRFQVEWDTHCQQTLAHHWPNVPRWGDVSTVNGADLPPVDVITYGFPCQDLSVAGKRAGLDGQRSHLFFEAVRIITEMREATNGRYPTWAVAENVAGLLNADGGSAMARVVDELAAAGSVVIEWATLDAQWFGVPQRRRRVFIASCFDPATGDRCPDPLFPVGKSSVGHPEESEPARETATGVVGTGVAFGALSFGGFTPLTPKSMTLRGSETTDSGHVIPAQVPFVKARRAQNPDDHETWVSDAANPTLNEFDRGDTRATTAVVFDPSRRDGARIQDDTVNTLTGHMGTGGNNTPMVAQPVPIQDGRDIEKHQNGIGIAQPGDPAYTLDTTGGQAVAQPVAFSHTQGIDCQPSTEHFPTLRVEGGGHAVMQPNLAVRRLTPIECERLMGWPDDHTLHRADSKTNADSTRYKMCGNGVASPVAAWIARHLANTITQ